MDATIATAPETARAGRDLSKEAIRIGTLVQGGPGAPRYIEQILAHGFESFQLMFWQSVETIDLKQLAKEVGAVLRGTGVTISSLGMFGNPLGDKDREKDRETLLGWQKCIDAAPLFGCDIVAGFAGRLVDKPINDSIPVFKNVF